MSGEAIRRARRRAKVSGDPLDAERAHLEARRSQPRAMRVLGFDPDLHNSGLAIVERTPEGKFVVLHAQIISVPAALKGDAAVRAMIAALPLWQVDYGDLFYGSAVVEGQEAYRGAQANRATPDVLIRLAHVAGAALRLYDGEIVAPKVWKGQVPKDIKQARICSKLGWDYVKHSGWVEPTFISSNPAANFPAIKGKQWSHVLDAIGLAIWKLEGS